MTRSSLPIHRGLVAVLASASLCALSLAPAPAQDAPPLPSSTTTTTTTTTSTTATTGTATAPAPAPRPAPARSSGDSGTASTAQVADAAQREQIRKQQEVFQAGPILANADKLYKAGEYAKAQQYYLSVLTAITPAPATQAVYNQAVNGLMRCNAYLYEGARKKGDFSAMEAILTQSLTYAPDDPKLKAELARVQAARRNPEDTSLYASPAVNDDFKKKVDTVQSLLSQAEQARRTGQYDLAEDKLKAILSLDPYNSAAQQALKKITAEKEQYAIVGEEQTRNQRLEEVTSKWSNPPRKASVDAVAPGAVQPISRSNAFEISQKLRSIVIPDYTLSDASLQNAIDYLSDRVRSLDTDHTGINFIPQPEALAQAKPITISLKNVPLGEVLRYLTQLAQVKFKVDQSAIFFVPLNAATDTLVHRQFNVDPSFFTVSAGPSDTAGGAGGRRTNATQAAAAVSGGSIDVKEQLTQRGVEFSAEGANASYLAAAGVLEVINTPDQMDLIEELVNASTGQTLMVNIEARFVEINQNDLTDLTVNTTFNPLSSGSPASTPGFGTNFRGATGGISQNNLAGLLSQEPRDSNGNIEVFENQLGISGMLDGHLYSMLLSALAQKRSADLLSAPSVRVRSGERATIDATRTFFYPTAYDAPQIITTQQQANNQQGGAQQAPSPAAAIPAFPSSFDKQEIGVILNAQPTVGGDSRTIDLSLVPEITDFEGFINYGDPITVSPGGSEAAVTLVSNQILQPVFNVRRVTTKVFVKDGFTVVLGGLIREDVQTIDDKVPVLGDLPFVGRFFQSKVRQNTKKNLLIMVTGKIVRPDGERFNATVDAGGGGAPVIASSVR